MKTGYLITARLKSQRLKRKILLDIDGDTVLDKVIKRCLAVGNVDEVVLCTSTNEQDAELEQVAEKHKIKFFKGDEDDVLKRLLDAARKENIDRFLSITADNPFHSILMGRKILDFDNRNNFDFIFTQNLPAGIAPYFIRTDALDVAVFMKRNSDTEIWGPFVKQPSFFKLGYLNVTNNSLPSDLRITCDYEADYQFIKSLYGNILSSRPDINDIIALFNTNPDIFDINKGIPQRKLDKSIIEEINNNFKKNTQIGIDYLKLNNILLFPGSIEDTFQL